MKRFILAIVFIIFILVSGNFALWFFNTSAITKSLERLKVSLAKEGLTLEYKELRFDSFKSWKIQGVIEEPSIKAQFLGTTFDLNTPRIDFISKPFSDEMTASIPGDYLAYKLVDKLLSYDTKLQFDRNSAPFIIINFDKSLNELVPMLEDGKGQVFRAIKSVSFKASNINFIDAKANIIEQKVEGVTFELNFHEPSQGKLRIDSALKITNSEVSQDFIEKSPDKLKVKIFQLLSKCGKNSYTQNISFSFNEKSQSYMSDLRVDLSEFSIVTDLFSIRSHGHVELNKEFIPDVDLTFTIGNYEDMLDFSNEYAKIVKEKFAYVRINDNEAAALKKILANFAVPNTKDAEIKLSTAGNKFTVSGKSLTELLAMAQPIFEKQNEIGSTNQSQQLPGSSKSTKEKK